MDVSSLATLGSPVPLQSQPVARFVDCQVPDLRQFQAQDQILPQGLWQGGSLELGVSAQLQGGVNFALKA